MKNYYSILGVPPDAAKAEIKNAYRQLVKKYHPDRNKSAGATDQFIKAGLNLSADKQAPNRTKNE